MTYEVIEGDCLESMRGMADASVDAVVTDPPYEFGFMGRAWDRTGITFDPATWREALRVAKPGAHLLAMGGTRTHHRLMVAIEDAGWEIRDCLMFLYGSGFPKSLDVSKAIDKAAGAEREIVGRRTDRAATPVRDNRGGNYNSAHGKGPLDISAITAPATDAARQWDGWGTALKPAYEPIIMARKPFVGTAAANVQQYGTGAINVDACRIVTNDDLNGGAYAKNGTHRNDGWGMQRGEAGTYTQPQGRWPANLILDESAAARLDEQSGKRPVSGSARNGRPAIGADYGRNNAVFPTSFGSTQGTLHNDSGGASRFFYTAKASRSERGEENNHPTVKPLSLMRWLVRLVTPPDGVVLDCFAGSGTTGCACMYEGFRFVGVEQSAEYAAIARTRIAAAAQQQRLEIAV